ncbi:MAG: UPF0164 family protein, partial [Spirochaetaceae bacterium]|nr:UPF0164 family protein [Spirochaetaceae bacterium]
RYWKNDGSGGILETFMNRLIIVLVILALSAPVWGDGNDAYASASEWFGVDPNAGRNSFLILSIPSGGKYEGMATAHTAMALDGGYIESNPAAGSFLPRTILSFSHVDWIADSGLETIAYTFRPEKNEDFGLGFSTKLLHVPFTGYNDWGSQYDRYGSSAVGWYTEFIAASAVSYNFLRSFYFGGISVGAGLKAGYRGVSASLEPGQNAVSLMGDIGVMTRFNFLKPYAARDMNFAVGATIKNLGAEFIEYPDPLPSYASLGLSYKPMRPLTVALDFNVPFNLNGEDAETFSIAAGLNADVAEFVSAHTGVLIKTGKPRFTIGADVRLSNMTLVANYTLDLATRLEMFDRMSLSVKVDLDTVRQLLIKDDVQELYLEGLDYYSRGELSEAIRYWENCLSLDPTFKPAREMLETAVKSMELEQELRSTLIQ